MNLAFLGFAMIIVFMALIMAKKLSPFTSLILVPVAFGLLAGYGWDTLGYAMDGIKSVASTFAMMTFAILYFGVMLTAGMFLSLIHIWLLAFCGDRDPGDPDPVDRRSCAGVAVPRKMVGLFRTPVEPGRLYLCSCLRSLGRSGRSGVQMGESPVDAAVRPAARKP